MTKLKIKLLAFQGAENYIFENTKAFLFNLFDKNKIDFVQNHPDILFFLTGGSESSAISSLNKSQFYGIIAKNSDNALVSAAAETKAYLDNSAYNSTLIPPNEILIGKFLDNYYNIKNGLENLNGKRLGLIGKSSDWLISSTTDPEILQSKFGISLININSSTLLDFEKANISEEFLSSFTNYNNTELKNASKVFTVLGEIIKSNDLSAITVECFPLVVEKSVTACLALALLNKNNIPAGCEGDTTSISNIMLVNEITGMIPWMANLANIKENIITFAHCTAPLNLVSDVNITTHFETDKGTSIVGKFKNDTVTILRTNNSFTKAFLAKGEIVSRPKYNDNCRTQIEVKADIEKANLLINEPLGNHHLIIPGDHIAQLTLLFNFLNIVIL